MSKRSKIIIVAVFAAVLIAAAIVAVVVGKKNTTTGVKKFTLEISSERDGFNESIKAKSSDEFLGQYLRTVDGLEFSETEYGIYITGYKGMTENMDEQYWWRIDVNGEASMTGADEIPLADSDTYSLTLVQGW